MQKELTASCRSTLLTLILLARTAEYGYNAVRKPNPVKETVQTMGRWIIETRGWQQILTHYCDRARPNDGSDTLRQDIGGGYVRCERCGEKFLPTEEPGNPRLLLRLKSESETNSGPGRPF